MSSCFTVNVSFRNVDAVRGYCTFSDGTRRTMIRAHRAIIAGSGSYHNSTMHTGVGNVNYVSYYVRHIHFEAEFCWRESILEPVYPAYAVLFKIPYKEPLFNDSFNNIKDFILYKEPEKVLGYDIATVTSYIQGAFWRSQPRFCIDIKKPFIVGPNDYVGVFYFIPLRSNATAFDLKGTAKVLFDPV